MSPLFIVLIVLGSVAAYLFMWWLAFVVICAMFPHRTKDYNYRGPDTIRLTAETVNLLPAFFWPFCLLTLPFILIGRACRRHLSSGTLAAIRKFNPEIEEFS